jgi:hypothetical protein
LYIEPPGFFTPCHDGVPATRFPLAGARAGSLSAVDNEKPSSAVNRHSAISHHQWQIGHRQSTIGNHQSSMVNRQFFDEVGSKGIN